MNPWQDFWMGVVTAFVAFIIVKIAGKKAGKSFGGICTMVAVMPFLFVLLGGFLGLICAGSDATTQTQVVNKTTTDYLNLLTINLPGTMLSDIGGAVFGAIIGAIT